MTTDRRRLILLVDGDDEIRRLLRTKFQAAGFRVQDAATASEARHLARADPPDVAAELDASLRGIDARLEHGWRLAVDAERGG